MKKRKTHTISIVSKSIIIVIIITNMLPTVYANGDFPSLSGKAELIHEVDGKIHFYSISPSEDKIMYGYSDDYYHYQLEIIDINGSNKIIIGEYITSNYRGLPIFNPSGTHILYRTNGNIAIYDIYNNRITNLSQNNMTYPTIPDYWVPNIDNPYPTNPDYWIPHDYEYSWDHFDISDADIIYSFNGSIYATDYQGTYENVIYSGRAHDPRFSNNGSRIIFTTHDELGSWEYGGMQYTDYSKSLHVSDINGTNHLSLADYSNRYSFLNKQFNFDDSKIYFTVELTHHPIESDNGIWVVDIDGSGLTKLIEGTYSFSFFHPNNEFLYYSTDTWAHHRGFKRMSLDGSNITSISSPGDYWSATGINPQGTELICAKSSDSIPERELWIMNHDGTDRKRLICDLERPMYPRFYSNGSKIMSFDYPTNKLYSCDLPSFTSPSTSIPGYTITGLFLCIGFGIWILYKNKARNILIPWAILAM